MTKIEESEGNYSYSTTIYPYELDFVSDEFRVPTTAISKLIKISKISALLAKTVSISSLKISWESLTFYVNYAFFIQRRVVAFVYFLETIKDTIVSVLMWRRGFLFRPTTHVGILILVSLALVVGSLFRSGVTSQDFSRDQVLAAENTPVTLIPDGRPRSEVIKYKIARGDTISKIASVYKISVDTVKWANGIEDADEIAPGDTLNIPPVTGIVHKVKKGETLASVTKKYKADAQTTATYPFNYLDDTLTLRTGQSLIIPGGKMPPPTPLPSGPSGPRNYPIFFAGGSGLFSWPVVGSLNQSPSWWHPAIDIGAPYGRVVSASAAGTVVSAGWSNLGFGNFVEIQHNNGYTTRYAHMAKVTVRAGQSIGKAQQVGTIGCTGFCTGSHLHYEIKRSGSFVNPLSVLP